LSFGRAEALAVWQTALARARDDAAIEADRAAYEYLSDRGVLASWETASFGLLAAEVPLPAAVADWPATGHVVVVPLYDAAGDVTNVQARAIRPAAKKTLFPKGSRAKGTLFASRTGLAVLQGQWTGPRCLVVGEGLTDFLALTITCPVPVLSAPGTGLAAHGVGPWISGFDVLLALDDDDAGAKARLPTAEAAYRLGARSVRRVVWPGRAKDACDVIARRGIDSLAAFLTRETEVSVHG
jgi:DNA primase